MSLSNKVKNFFQGVMKPSPAAVSQAIKALKPHTPLIKFRNGPDTGHAHGAASASQSLSSSGSGAANSPRAPSTPLKPNEAMQLPTIEDWQLPQRYRRRPLDSEEIDFINRGGPDYDPPKPKAKAKK